MVARNRKFASVSTNCLPILAIGRLRRSNEGEGQQRRDFAEKVGTAPHTMEPTKA